MSCDIHIVLERKFGKLWIGVRELGYTYGQSYNSFAGLMPIGYIHNKLCERDYGFFFALAGVRGDEYQPGGGTPRGLPGDCSTLSLALLDSIDLHSHSYTSLTELIPIIQRCKIGHPVAMQVAAKLLNVPPSDIAADWIGENIGVEEYPNWRIVYAFDN